MCDRAGLLVAYDLSKRVALVSRANCDSWSCPQCAERLRLRWEMRARLGVTEFVAQGLRVDFVTITSHERLKTFAETEHVWRSAWATLYAALKRKAKTLEYMIVPEKHKDGRMHVHALWTADVSERWLKDNARRRGLGYQAKVKPVEDVQKAGRYVAKYLGKSLGDDAPPRFRRVRVSRGWAEIADPITELSNYVWHYVDSNGKLNAVYVECDRENLTMIDVKSGEVFDDIDLWTETV